MRYQEVELNNRRAFWKVSLMEWHKHPKCFTSSSSAEWVCVGSLREVHGSPSCGARVHSHSVCSTVVLTLPQTKRGPFWLFSLDPRLRPKLGQSPEDFRHCSVSTRLSGDEDRASCCFLFFGLHVAAPRAFLHGAKAKKH